MTLLNTADAVYVGDVLADAVYLGDTLVWSASPWDSDTQRYLDATGLDGAYAPALDGLVLGLKSVGLWSKMVAVYPFIGGTQALHRWNLMNPADTDAAYRLTFMGGTDTHSDALGYVPNPPGVVANGGYADTHMIPRGIFDQNSTHLAYYSLSAEIPLVYRAEIGCYRWPGSEPADARFHVIAHYAPDGLFYFGMAEDGASSAPSESSLGLFVATRTEATLEYAYHKGGQIGVAGVPSIWLPTNSIWVGGINTYIDRTDLPCGFASIGTGLSAVDVADLNRIVTDYQTALGRQALVGYW